MKIKPIRTAPVLITLLVIFSVCLVRLMRPDFFERQERMTYDMRVRQALKFSPPVATNLGFVCIDDASIDFVRTNTTLGYRFGLYWPRRVYARLVMELAAQDAKAVALDVLFGELRPDHPMEQMADGRLVESDDFFAMQMRRASNVIIAATKDLKPPPLFATNALALADISTIKIDSGDREKDSDGILRRARAFRVYRTWHWAFRHAEADPKYAVDLSKAQASPQEIVLPRSDLEDVHVPLDSEGNFDLADFFGDQLPPGIARKAKPFTDERIWHMGIVLAAQELGLDLSTPQEEPGRGEITLFGRNGIRRTIPVDDDGCLLIDWCIPHDDPRLVQEPIKDLLWQNRQRLDGHTNGLVNRWAGKLVVVGSSAIGNDLTDRGATPIESETLLASEHWNVANSVLMGRFIHRSSTATDLLLFVILGITAGLVTWHLRALLAFLLVALVLVGYVVLGNYLFIEHRYWLPLFLPLTGALLLTHVCLVTWRVVFEQAEKRRVRSIFSRIVSPNIVNELLQAETLSVGGARREVTVLFADVRGFTEFTDLSQERAAAHVAEQKLTGEAMDAYIDEQARETLGTVNTYLGLVADMVKKHDGTLDKYIGDCVMAFWGAPTPNPRHSLACVRAAIDVQRAIYDLNLQRTEENKRREEENRVRTLTGLTETPLLPVLLLGSGINTGMVTVGLMGSEAHISNYTVFGREVNLASRLESLSGRGRILISEATYQCLLREDPPLAAKCVALPDANVKGIRLAVKVYEVPWRLPDDDTPAAPISSPVQS